MGEWNLRTMYVCLFGVMLMRVNAQEGSDCFTSNYLPGICVNTYSCDHLSFLRRSNIRNAHVIRFHQETSCGFFGSQPLVCCIRKAQPIQTASPPIVSTATLTGSQEREEIEETTESEGREGYKLPRWPNCGLRNDSGSLRVVGGRPAELGEIPWIAALGYKNKYNINNPNWFCGGSLITDKHVLTAGHCIEPNLYLVRVGDLDLYSNDDGAQPINIPIARTIRHEHYNRQLLTNDIAILALSLPAKGYLITPICLPIDEPLRSQTFENYTPLVAGWGSIYYKGPSSSHLQVAQLPVVSLRICAINYAGNRKATIDDRVLCSGYPEGKKDACQGDSGGPLFLSNRQGDHQEMYLIGVVSYGIECARPVFPGVYTRVTKFLDWIERKLVDD